MKKVCSVAFFILLIINIQIKSEDRTETMKKLEARKSLIHNAAQMFGVNERYLKAVIYVERTMNYDWKDDVLDEILAASGLNSSLGFCQVKLKTAYWIENQLNNAESEFYPGDKYKGLLKISGSPKEIIKKLYNDSLNICYAAAYIKIMLSRWKTSGFPIDDKPEIMGTLYFAGLFTISGEERKPRLNPVASRYGMMVKESTKLLK
ncbi:MAG: hypothetical protein HF300_03180 [Ignavibacteria bacterium]|nr:hypothetical protein [Ignavibacteria bacterium]HEX2962566.1 hypothetical protein [Ignavibacteriales bacterium]MCU7500145.1 hypothetical protein [Ignavibacteria bacterium]MCU7511532.1 hypothetical protein [Ignavibacteria bacterium]MCU7521037.1 hypothetical protein [Ignavibacteria bacterium]